MSEREQALINMAARLRAAALKAGATDEQARTLRALVTKRGRGTGPGFLFYALDAISKLKGGAAIEDIIAEHEVSI